MAFRGGNRGVPLQTMSESRRETNGKRHSLHIPEHTNPQ